MSRMIMWVRALAEGPRMNLGDWCPVPITDLAGEYWASRLICSCERAMGRWEFSQHWKPSFWVMDVTVRKLVAGSEGTGNA